MGWFEPASVTATAPVEPRLRRVALVIPTMGCGGAERVMAVLANRWAASGHQVTIVTLEPRGESAFYTLDDRIHHVQLDAMATSRGLRDRLAHAGDRIRRLRATIQTVNPDVAISFIDRMNVLTVLATRALGVPVVVSERVHPARLDSSRRWNLLRDACYSFADAVVVQTEDVAACFPTWIARRAEVIPNPVPVPDVPARPRESRADRVLLAAGRLVPQKGFDLLLDAFARIASNHPRWRLVIWGDGPERRSLERTIHDRNLVARVLLPGWTKDLTRELGNGDAFVLSSRFEGFPNALCEAMAVGLPVVSFCCPSGPNEIIRHDVDGLLVADQDVPGLAAALDRLMRSSDLRADLGGRARDITTRFGVAAVAARWEDLIDRLSAEAR